MTYRQKLLREHPDKVYTHAMGGCEGCPGNYGYSDLKNCTDGSEEKCTACWDQEIPKEEIVLTRAEKLKEKYPELIQPQLDDMMRAYCPEELGICSRDEQECESNKCSTCWNEELKESTDISTIKDSGDRTQFESGAVRDMRAGKGRCDLMPLEVVAKCICDSDVSSDTVILDLKKFLETGSTSYLYSALNTFDVMRWDCVYTMFLEVAKHFEDGAKKYGENNWQKGIPTKFYIDSAIRHYLKWRRGDTDEPHDRAFVWNLMCCIWEVDYHKTDA